MPATNYSNMSSYASRRTEIKVKLLKKDLLFDMDASTHLLSEAEKAQATAKQADILATDSTEVFGLRVLSRYLETRGAQLSQVLNNYVPTTSVSTGTYTPKDDQLKLTGTSVNAIEYTFKVSVEYNDSNTQPLALLMHEYVVKGALLDWYNALGINKGVEIPARLQELEARMHSLFLARDFFEMTM